MPFAFFSIPAAARPEVAAELNAFLRSHRVLRVTQQWHEKEGAWAFNVEYVDGAVSSTSSPLGDKVDYKETLPPEQFEVFARLRALRKTIAEREGTPVFAVFILIRFQDEAILFRVLECPKHQTTLHLSWNTPKSPLTQPQPCQSFDLLSPFYSPRFLGALSRRRRKPSVSDTPPCRGFKPLSGRLMGNNSQFPKINGVDGAIAG